MKQLAKLLNGVVFICGELLQLLDLLRGQSEAATALFAPCSCSL
jgi:hypothetical protein